MELDQKSFFNHTPSRRLDEVEEVKTVYMVTTHKDVIEKFNSIADKEDL